MNPHFQLLDDGQHRSATSARRSQGLLLCILGTFTAVLRMLALGGSRRAALSDAARTSEGNPASQYIERDSRAFALEDVLESPSRTLEIPELSSRAFEEAARLEVSRDDPISVAEDPPPPGRRPAIDTAAANRAVPLTRSPLRDFGKSDARHGLAADARMHALRALTAEPLPEGQAALEEALRSGNDAERFAAIDGLARLGLREHLATALSDRVEAIAAKAALAFAGSRRPSEVRAALLPYVDEVKLEAILTLLAGMTE